jgi:hypothetical protein
MRPSLEQVLNAVTASTNSAAIVATNVLYVSVQAVATSTIAGTVKIQFSNDIVNEQIGPTNWIDIPSATVSLTGTAGAFGIAKIDSCYKWLRIVFTKSGGTGTVSVNVNTIGA